MSRYLERAENLARMLEVSYSLSLMPQAGRSDGLDELAMSLLCSGTLDSYLERHPTLDAERMLHFFALDEENPASIYNCLRAARGNAHAVRGRITADMWENLNATWLEMRQLERRKGPDRTRLLFDHMRQRAHMIRGVTVVAMLRDEAFHFLRLGSFLERADGTLRLLDARSGSTAGEPHGDDPHEWTVLLRTLSAFEAYRRLFRDAVTPQRVAEMFLLRPDVPRSLRRCLIEVRENLKVVANGQSAQTERMVGSLQAQLEFGEASQLAPELLRDYLTDKIEQLQGIGEGIARDFLVAEARA
jgi:uncharacterized alpha-E superfamily protein